MSAAFNVIKTTGVTGAQYSSVIGRRAPNAHPCNCKHECPYGKDRAFCFPCYAKIMNEHRASRKSVAEGV